ncbi:MAG TPA: hypothetical protein VF070_02280 [Streptosporangiaceae bacterium]
MTAVEANSLTGYGWMEEPTPAHVWRSAAGRPIADELIEWPPDLFALTNVILERSEAFRFALAPAVWPPRRYGDWALAVEEAGRRWSAWAEDRRGAIPQLLRDEWSAFMERVDIPLEQLATGRDWRMCEALLTLHAIADEACAGLGIALDSSDGNGCAYRARGRELLARTGSLARVNPRFMRVLPKVCTPPAGRAAFSRYACVQGPGIEARWYNVPARHRGTDVTSEYATLLLLPWPLRVRASDFRPVAGSVHKQAKEATGFFEFAPAEGLDLDLLDRVLAAAREEVNSVDLVVLPESAVDEDDIEELENVLHRHGVIFLQAGVRQRSRQPGRMPGNWVHIGFNARLEKGAALPGPEGRPWFHLRQNKHHRWSLDESQIFQYHLGGVLHPDIRWQEAMEAPRLAVAFIEVAELTLVSLVCEDLAQNDDLADLMRSVGPTVVMTSLLDGPQLTSRWAARYASVLADDPGSAVLTLTSFGMASRSRPPGHDASPVIALWKDPSRGVREIPLEAGAHGVVLSVCMSRAARRSADGRRPVDNGTYCYDVAVHQVRAANEGAGLPRASATGAAPHLLEIGELTILTAWAEAVAEVLEHAPHRAAALLDEARPGAAWRAALGLSEPSPQLTQAIASMSSEVLASANGSGAPEFDVLLSAANEGQLGEQPLDGLVRQVLRAVLEERRTRQPTTHASGHQESRHRIQPADEEHASAMYERHNEPDPGAPATR